MDADRQRDAPVEAGGLIRPLVQQSTPDLIAGMIRNAIAAGEFEPGAQLREKQLAERLAVSRGSLREALQRLIQEGLLRTERNRGVYVQDLDAGRIADVYLVRGALERCAGEVIISNSDTAVLARLQEIVDAMIEAGGRGDTRQTTRLDLRFHRTLVAASNSDYLQRMFSTLMLEVGMCLAALGSTAHDNRSHVVAEHQDILAAIEAGDPTRLAGAVNAHMRSAVKSLQAAIEHNHLMSDDGAPAPRTPASDPTAASELI